MTQTYSKEESTITMNGQYKPWKGIWVGLSLTRAEGAELWVVYSR